MKALQVTTTKEAYFVEQELKPSKTKEVDFAIDITKKKQTILGFGGAITDAAISVYETMDAKSKKRFFDLVYGEEGLAYNFARLTIGSCDFSKTIYDYAQKDDLSDFSLKNDEPIIALVKEAQKKRPFHVMASCWSPLARYKDNGNKSHGGHLKEDCYEAHADYIAAYVHAMAKAGVNIEDLTIQNEPEAVQTWESCLFSEKQEAHLAKILHQKLPEVSLFAWDHNRDVLVRRITNTFNEPGARNAYEGIAYHWYDAGCSEEIAKVHALYPEKKILFTEGCVELLNLNHDHPEQAIGNFDAASRYAENYLKDLKAGSQGFLDWNVLLDLQGGPNHVGNYCEAPLMYGNLGLRINPSYYAIKHFSSFVKEGACFLDFPEVSQLLSAGLLNPDGSIVLVFLNKGIEKPISFSIESQTYSCYIKGNSMTSIVFRK
jgi:glucosylceramidase